MPETAGLIQITGMTRCGKSTLLKKIVLQRPRVIAVSPFPLGDKLGVEQFGSVREAVEAFQKFQGRTFRVAIIVRTPEDFAQVCQLAWVLAPCTLALDETTIYMPSPASVPMEFKLLSQAWAHAGDVSGESKEVSVIAVGQRPVNLPPIFRSEVQVWYLFRLNARSDRKMLEDDFGLTNDQAEAAGKLPRYSFMRVDRFGDLTRGTTSA